MLYVQYYVKFQVVTLQYYEKFQVVALQLGVIVDFTSYHLSFLYGIFGDTYLTIFQYNTQLPWEPQLKAQNLVTLQLWHCYSSF